MFRLGSGFRCKVTPTFHRASLWSWKSLGIDCGKKGATCAGRLERCPWFQWRHSIRLIFGECLLGCKGEFDMSPFKTGELNWWKLLSMKLGWLCSHHEMFEMSHWICCQGCQGFHLQAGDKVTVTSHRGLLISFEPLATLLLYWIMHRTSNNQTPSITVHIEEYEK